MDGAVYLHKTFDIANMSLTGGENEMLLKTVGLGGGLGIDACMNE